MQGGQVEVLFLKGICWGSRCIQVREGGLCYKDSTVLEVRCDYRAAACYPGPLRGLNFRQE